MLKATPRGKCISNRARRKVSPVGKLIFSIPGICAAGRRQLQKVLVWMSCKGK